MVRLDDDMLRLVEEEAARAGVDVSQFVHEAIVARLLGAGRDLEALGTRPAGEPRPLFRDTRAESRALMAESRQAHRRADALRKQAAALAESALGSRFDVVFRATASYDKISLLDASGNQEQDLGSWLEAYVHADDRAWVGATIHEAIKTTRAVEIEHRGVRTDGSTGCFHTRAVALSRGDGEISEWLLAYGDITEQVSRTNTPD